MKRFALPALFVAAAFFAFNSTASADHGHGGRPGHSHGGGGYGSYYGQSYGGGSGCNSRGFGSSYHRGNYFNQSRSYRNYGRQYHNRGFNRGFNRGYNQGGIRIRTGNFGFGLRF